MKLTCRRLTFLLAALLNAAGGTASATTLPNPPQEEADEFHFVVLGDAQFHDPVKFNRVIDQTRRLRPAFVIQVGDLIKGYNSNHAEVEQEWLRFARQVAPLAPIPYIPVPGNHDVYNGERRVDEALEAIFIDTWGPLYFSFVYKNTLFVGLNSDSTEGANQITGQQWRWLKQTLRNHQSRHKFVFMHRPPLMTKNAKALHQLFQSEGVSHVFYGHHHHYHFFERDGIAYTMTNAAATSAHEHPQVGGFHHLLQVSVRGSEVEVAVIEADAIHPQDAVAPQDNYDTFALYTELAPDHVMLRKDDEGHYSTQLPLHNTSDRDVTIYVTCASDDQRWIIEPQQVPPLSLAPGEKRSLTLEARFSRQRQPESTAFCSLRIPLQSQQGVWFDINRTVQLIQ